MLIPSYQSELYRPDQPPVQGHLELSRVGLTFMPDHPSGEGLIWPMDGGLHLRLGGAQDQLIFFSHDDHPRFTIATEDLTVLEHTDLQDHPELAVVRRRHRWIGTAVWLAVGATMAAGLAMLALLYWFFFV